MRLRHWLEYFFGPWLVRSGGVEYPQRPTVEFEAGSRVTLEVSDVPDTDATKIRISAQAGSGTPGGANGSLQIRNGDELDGLPVVPISKGGTGLSDPGPAGTTLLSNGLALVPSMVAQVPPGNKFDLLGRSSDGDLINLGLFSPIVCGHRLTVAHDWSAIPESPVINAATLYLAPHEHALIGLYDGERWVLRKVDVAALSLTGMSAGVYDVFVYWDAVDEVARIEPSTVWTDATTPANALARQDGVWVKSGDPTRRHVGTIWLTGTGQTQWTERQHGVWNRHNQVDLVLSVADDTDSWAYTTASWRAARNQATNSVQYVTGDVATLVEANARHSALSSGSNVYYATGVGVDSTSTNSASLYGDVAWATFPGVAHALYRGRPGRGQRTITWLEYGGANLTFHGDRGAPASWRNGMVVEYRG